MGPLVDLRHARNAWLGAHHGTMDLLIVALPRLLAPLAAGSASKSWPQGPPSSSHAWAKARRAAGASVVRSSSAGPDSCCGWPSATARLGSLGPCGASLGAWFEAMVRLRHDHRQPPAASRSCHIAAFKISHRASNGPWPLMWKVLAEECRRAEVNALEAWKQPFQGVFMCFLSMRMA